MRRFDKYYRFTLLLQHKEGGGVKMRILTSYCFNSVKNLLSVQYLLSITNNDFGKSCLLILPSYNKSNRNLHATHTIC